MIRPASLLLALAAALLGTPGFAAPPPVAVSPGSATGTVLEARCPTFHWGAVAGAEAYELAVYRIEDRSGQARPIWREELPGAARVWTPPLDRCLEGGGRYGWAVRALGGGGAGVWSEARLFRIAAGPSLGEVEQALATLRLYLSHRQPELPPVAATPLAATGPPAGTAPRGGRPGVAEPAPSTPLSGTAQLRVEAAAGPGIRGLTEDESILSAGVLGEAINSADVSAAGIGVMGRSNAALGSGVHGFADGNRGVGVQGIATGDLGLGGHFIGQGTAQGLIASGGRCCDSDDPTNYAARLINTSSASDPDVLSLQLQKADPGTSMTYLGFFDRTPAGQLRLLGEVQGDGMGGIHYKGSHLTLSPTATPLACSAGRAAHAGRIYFDDSLNEPCYCDGTNWQQFDGGGVC